MGGGQCEVEDGLARATRQPPDDRRDSIGHECRNNCGSSGEYGDRRFGLNDGDQNGRGLVVSGGRSLHGMEIPAPHRRGSSPPTCRSGFLEPSTSWASLTYMDISLSLMVFGVLGTDDDLRRDGTGDVRSQRNLCRTCRCRRVRTRCIAHEPRLMSGAGGFSTPGTEVTHPTGKDATGTL